ncbi:MAG: hypothetical protein H0V93_08850 [Euzebyales bacterium]|jgi:hypothetical protein|nr:hypothetical protein [Euzebyales bacterium]
MSRQPRTLRSDVAPVAVPGDIAEPDVPKASGRVTLPHHVNWSAPHRVYDLSDCRDRTRVYEQVLREGLADDVRR